MLGTLLRFIVAALVILFLGFLLPGFHILGFWTAMLAAAGVAALGSLLEAAAGHGGSPYRHGLAGFVAGAAVLYGVPFLVPQMSISLVGALAAALIIGVVDAFVPSELH